MAKKFKIRWDRIVGGIVMGAILGIMLVWSMDIGAGIGPDGKWYPECQTEDSNNCHWDGGANGLGKTFFVIDDIIYYE
jgi:hypothetical protein